MSSKRHFGYSTISLRIKLTKGKKYIFPSLDNLDSINRSHPVSKQKAMLSALA